MDFKALGARLGLDEQDFMELVELFVTTTIADIEKIKTSLAEASPADAAAASHSIKGAAGNLGFEAIADLALDMEMGAKSGSLDSFESWVADLESQVLALTSS